MTPIQIVSNELVNSLIAGTVAAGMGVGLAVACSDKKHLCTKKNLTDIALAGLFSGTFVASSVLTGRLTYQFVPCRCPCFFEGFFHSVRSGLLMGVLTVAGLAVTLDNMQHELNKKREFV